MRTIEAPAGVDIEITAGIEHLCPVVDERDTGRIRIAWTTDGQTFELHDLARYIRSWAEVTISHEQLADVVRTALSEHDGIAAVGVTLSFETAGMAVTAEVA